MSETFSIGELSRRTGVVVETIRFYERLELLPKPPRTAGNYRVYQSVHLQRLAFIKRSRDVGFGVEQIKSLLELADRTDHACGDVDTMAKAQLLEVERKIAELQTMRDELQDMLSHCASDTVRNCRVVRRLQGNDVEDRHAMRR